MELQELATKVGEVIVTSDWITVDQNRINQFAETTEDRQYIHVDPEAAKSGPFGTTIAHGFLTLSLLSVMLEETFKQITVQMSVNYGFDKVRFLAPVKSGKRIRGHFKLLELTEKRPGQWQKKVEATVEIEGEEKPALIADWIFMHMV
ncbi:MAG: MaoC family dehydratase [Novosphingobium sp.]